MTPVRKAALVASSAIRLQDLSSEEEVEDHGTSDTWNNGVSPKQRPRPKQTYGKGGKKRARASTGSVQMNSPELRGRKSMDDSGTTPRRRKVKRERSRSSARSESLGISYTPLKPNASLRDLMDGLLPKSTSVLAPPTSPQEEPSSSLTSLSSQPEEWSLGSLGSFVWVRVNRSGEVVEKEQDVEMTFWWPAKVLRSTKSNPLEVSFFGKISDLAPSKSRMQLPSASNVLPMMLPNGVVRFNQHSYVQVGSSSRDVAQDSPSPRKRQYTDVVRRWSDAADAMLIADADDNGGLSARLSGFSGTRTMGSTKRNVAPLSISSLSDDEPDLAIENDYEADPMLKIPGELVFSLENKSKKEYWPAQILEYIPPKKGARKVKPKYHLLFLDGMQKNAERDWFFASYQEGFQTCKLGEFKSDQPLEINGNDDSESEMEEYQTRRSPAPTTPPITAQAFCKLTLREQFSYVKPVLVAILNERYVPVASRHQRFMQGGTARAKLDRDAGHKGSMTGKEVSQLTKMLTRWILPEKVKASLILDEADTQKDMPNPEEPVGNDEREVLTPLSDLSESPSPSVVHSEGSDQARNVLPAEKTKNDVPPEVTLTSRPSRQQGCLAYERLADREKLDYCTNILVPEAVIQILLRRAGMRTVIEVLSDGEEERLHKTGLELAQKSDWVNEIMRLRKNIGRKAQVVVKPVMVSTRTRPKVKATR